MRRFRWLLSVCLGLLSWQSLGAATLSVRYSGRLVDGSGAPRTGPLAIEATFFRVANGGAPVGATQSFSDVALADGIFELPLTFSPGEFHALFADDQPVWIELKDAAHGLTLPRQRLEAAPYARKVPVDGVTLSFDSDGKLTVGTIAASQVTGLNTALGDKVATSDLTTALAGKADATAMTAALAGKADAAHSHTLAGDVSGDVAATVVTKLRGSPIGTTAPSSAGQVLKWDGSEWAPGPDDGGASGVITNGTSLGGGEEIYKDVSAPDIRFRTLTAGSNASVTTAGDTILIATTPGLTTSAPGGVVLGPHDVNAGDTGELRFQELAAGGGNYVGFKAPDALAGDMTYTLPAAAPASDGQVLSGTTAGGLSWATLPGALPPSGSAGGDLSGSYPNPTIAANAVDTAELNDSAVTGAKIAADTITAADIAADAVTASEIAAGAVGGSELAADAVTSAKIQDGQVQTADLAASAVTTAEIADGTIANADIAAAAAVARSKLAAGTADHVLINNGSGVMTSEAQLATSRGGTGISSTATFPAAGVIATRDATEALANKTLGSTNTLTGAAAASFTNGAATVTLPTATGTLATLAGTETLTNKTLTSPIINGGTMSVALGAVGAPSYAFTGDADTGAWSSGADTWNLSTAGAERVRVTSAGNVGIGTTTPSGRLEVQGGITGTWLGTGAPIKLVGQNGWNGIGGNLVLMPGSGTDASSNPVALATGTGNRNGYIGIGTATPSYPVDIEGGTAPWVTNGAPVFISGQIGNNSSGGSVNITGGYSTNAAGTNIGSYGSILLNANGGNVGIGTTAPNFNLQVSNASTSTKVVTQFTNGSTGTTATDGLHIGVDSDNNDLIWSYDANAIKFGTNNSEKMRLDSTGNVGIGTTSPASPLHVRASTAGSNVITLGDGRANDFVWVDYKGSPQASGGYTIGGNRVYSSLAAANTLVGSFEFAKEGSGTDNKTYIQMSTHNGTSFGERVRIDSAGNVGIGTTTPAANLHIRGPSSGYHLQLDGTTAGGNVWQKIGNTSRSWLVGLRGDESDNFTIYDNTANADRLSITSTGNVGIGTTAPGQALEINGNVKAGGFISTSDGRLKTDIKTVSGWDIVSRLRGVRYRWRSNGQSDIGLIAQEVEDVVPDAVVTDPNSGLKAVKYPNLIAPLIETAKNLHELCSAAEKQTNAQSLEIDELRRQVDELRAERDRLDAEIRDIKKLFGTEQ